ncbi:hypothetical protein [Pseudomonas sp. ACM7]|uniref:hypothetical protein n=1 Tax=Pseudomonas sp. ACM7 TaxID=2052956 RepID=UPI001011D385|nr:hypothetical protein [Pseudomonas sp. ACM7]QAY93662.1 hypothetical protein CUN63_29325 [Pseudomonas sp. ACM7]
MTTRVQEINRIQAVNRYGKEYTIIESATQMAVSIMRDTTIWVNKEIYFRAENHGPVSKINELEFVVFLTGEKLKRI